MKIKILFDKDRVRPEFKQGWGVSYLIGDNVLFDTGEKFESLEHNAKLMGADLKKIEFIVVSHEHWDHVGGLWKLLEMNKEIIVYGCSRFSGRFKERVAECGAELREIKRSLKIANGIYSIGEFATNYKDKVIVEQSLAITEKGKITLICACAHAGVLNLVERTRYIFRHDVNRFIGGLHLMDKDKRFINYVIDQLKHLIKEISPSHCTGYEAQKLIKKAFGEGYIGIKSGMEITL